MNLSSGPMLRRVKIAGTGSYLPEKRLTNFDLEKMVETTDEWIVQRTGMHERRVAADDQATSDLALEASKRAIESAGLTPQDIDMIMVGTITPDTVFPSTACILQHKLGARMVPAFDLAAACSGFIYALSMARTQVASGAMDNILVVGAEVLTRVTDYQDRGSCILFGDGAGAAVLTPATDDVSYIVDTHMAADGSGGEMLILPAGGSRHPATHETVDRRMHYMVINGRAVFKEAVATIVRLVDESLERCHLQRSDIKMVIPHQMNARIIESAAKRLDIPMEKIFINLDKYGNTSAATIPIALDEAARQGVIERGDLIALVTFGGGLTWGSSLIRY